MMQQFNVITFFTFYINKIEIFICSCRMISKYKNYIITNT